MADIEQIRIEARRIEEMSINAWPALNSVIYDGWILRFAAGHGRRVNSVNALYSSSIPVEEKIDYCEQAYSSVGLPAVFKISPAVQPLDLEAHLVHRGYELDAPTSVQILDLASSRSPISGAGEPEETTLGEWLQDYGALSGTSSDRLQAFGEMAVRIVPQRTFLRLTLDRRLAATGLAVMERGWVGLYNLEVHADLRREGLGSQLVEMLLSWGQANGAKMAYLFVMQDNLAALGMYAKLGFRQIYSYRFRIRFPERITER